MESYVERYKKENPAEYPIAPYGQGATLLASIGSFWESIFTDNDKLLQLFNGYMLEAGQAYQKFLETLATSSRLEVPVFARDNWYHLVISENDIKTDIAKYGDGRSYGDGFQYGVRAFSEVYTVEAPANLKKCEFIFNRIINPSLSLVSGVDFSIRDGLIEFNKNPFDSEFTVKIPVIDEDTGETVDHKIGLWVYAAEFDLEYIWQHWGYILNMYMESSTYYRDFINAVADSYVLGPNIASLENLLQAMSGIPLVRENGEVVEAIVEYPDKKVVVTDKYSYRFEPSAELVVSEGQVLNGGDSMTDSLRVIEIFSETPSEEIFPAMVCGQGFVTGEYISELTFVNKDVALEYVGLDANGNAEVRFEVSGYDSDVESFWSTVHTNGLMNGTTLAEYLDTRENPTSQPTPEFLPATINPLDFVLKNFFGNHLCFIRMKSDDFADGVPGVSWFRAVRQILPPHVTSIVYVELNPPDTYIELSDNDEVVDLLDITDLEEELDETVVSEAIILMEVKDC